MIRGLLLIGLLLTGAVDAATDKANLAIWPIDVVSLGAPLSEADQLSIEFIVPDILASIFSQTGLSLVERERLLEILSEQKLGASALADEATRLRLGKLLGAQSMLFGQYTAIAGQWQLDLRVVATQSSEVLASASADNQSGDLFMVVEGLAAQLAGTLAPSNDEN